MEVDARRSDGRRLWVIETRPCGRRSPRQERHPEVNALGETSSSKSTNITSCAIHEFIYPYILKYSEQRWKSLRSQRGNSTTFPPKTASVPIPRAVQNNGLLTENIVPCIDGQCTRKASNSSGSGIASQPGDGGEHCSMMEK